MRTIKGLTVKEWLKILGLPALIAAEFAILLAFSGDVANAAAIVVVVFAFSICLAVYIQSAVNAYHECRGERMSREDMEKTLKLLKHEWAFFREYNARIRKDLSEVQIELEKTRTDLRRIDLRDMVRDKE